MNPDESDPAAPLSVEVIGVYENPSRLNWRSEVSAELRNHLTEKIKRALSPNEGPSRWNDEFLQFHACEIEQELFEKAASKDYYFYLLAEKIYSIKRDLIQRALNQPSSSSAPCEIALSYPSKEQVRRVAPERLRRMQQQLILMLHSVLCTKRDRERGYAEAHCSRLVPHCSTMKNVLQHMKNCVIGKSCQYPHCSASQQILGHWKYCDTIECPLCHPVSSVAKIDLSVIN